MLYDYLKAKAASIHFFGLGFIQIKMNDPKERYHFYVRELPLFVEEPHNHRYGFYSEILKGCLTMQIWELIQGDTHLLSLASCEEGAVVTYDTQVAFKKSLWCIYEKDSCYDISASVFHTVRSLGGSTITRITRHLPYETQTALVSRKVGEEKKCPFSQKENSDYLWELVKKHSEGL